MLHKKWPCCTLAVGPTIRQVSQWHAKQRVTPMDIAPLQGMRLAL
jgi:hypothetical protein